MPSAIPIGMLPKATPRALPIPAPTASPAPIIFRLERGDTLIKNVLQGQQREFEVRVLAKRRTDCSGLTPELSRAAKQRRLE